MDNKKSYLGPLFMIGVIFFVMGFITWVNGTLITFFKKAFSLDNTSSYLVTFAFFISYTIMAIPCSYVVKKTGFKNGMSLALLVMAAGTLIFIPAAEMASYPVFLVGLFTIGIGLTVLQTSSNPYATILGPRESAAQRISIMGIANKSAGILSQVIIGKLLLSGASSTDPQEELDKVVVPYLVLTAILVGLAILIRMSKGLVEVSEEEEAPVGSAPVVEKTSVFQFPNLVLGVIALFCYVGVEVIAGDTIINYGVSLGFAEEEARLFGTYTLGGMMFGYVLGIVLIPKYVSQQAYLMFSAVLGMVVTIAAIFTTGFASVLCIAILGFANAVIWPALWPLALSGLGKFTKIASALLVMGISGGAVMPLVYGGIADSIKSTQQAYWIMVPLYIFILYFGLVGHKKKSW
ncbi:MULTISPECIES: sugar MFS transporter [Dyadobacter]|jgi:FHS family L-fucose permease-like MFS transporter|uniref:Sugar MFS transporter n=1 Tax=Dyadobacter chenhuakuii TaxID=2909339 RepID=A0A9X1QBT7_9BACT|nr:MULTISPECIES: sugar MFS transporter [Dyadobacter]MCE7072449.1 sugar MFS transporter [Dyadobacter sp. CY327]MCF2494501.1 sugar MFS transporter [Dyadobacter chenhuakuii]MCF2497592.1 sugar MFS transporter [Dyadobacter chenhuakuii]MCF2519770.1 sugar MFS transporter [Dyadobacter sp. CY351]USJ32175.1 sugar MFS transporter [Dyadobacter chenhuakuii]